MKRILTGDRPTGKLHLGHYVGSLKNRVKLQDQYEQFVMIADVQALTDNFDNPQKVRDSVRELTLDYLAVGIDPRKTTIFIQSLIPEIAELTVFYLNLVTLARLERNPTVKDEMKQKGFGSDVPVGFVAYPISQAADITFLKADLVPVGEDQLPMIEQTREIVRKFNSLYSNVLKEPEALVGEFGRLIGTDGSAKMSKSLGNVIYLSDSAQEVDKKVMNMYTDPNRIHPTDPGKVEDNPVFIYLDAFGAEDDQAQITELKDRYKMGQVGDIEVKRFLVQVLNNFLEPIRIRRAEYQSQPELIYKILKEGSMRARQEAQKTMEQVRKAMKINYFSLGQTALASQAVNEQGEIISIDDFARVKLKAGKVLGVTEVEGSEKLYRLQVDLGEDKPRQILSGIKKWYKVEDLLNKQIIVISNLQPRQMMGWESQGMLLAAEGEDHPVILTPNEVVTPGAKIR